MTSFEQYSDILFDAFVNNARSMDLADKKKEILDRLFDYHKTDSDQVLFVGFSPAMLKLTHGKLFVTEVSTTVRDYFKSNGIDVVHITQDQIKNKQFSTVIAVDEYLTFAESDQEQRDKVVFLSQITSDFIVTTLRDYKNQDFKDREFSIPTVVRRNDHKKIYFEHYEYDINDRNACQGTNYIIEPESLTITGPFARRSMYFKQLAKFSLDAGAQSFLVHKNLMHKSIIKKTYEHIITIKF